ncbi:unnamed protein product [Bursaphelenchus okinawaensis]|uniref:Cytochrome P450 n=1 Tax=Bursaphelenchus okinawaensis TaxID=465554 RepID=A0A811LH31_9BILA|nr:unnamed protein product [Bursaphelenchus okinawaensis]CAG9125121.1 unnamed protein product [Bursaphelenchus okinawaensis]
MILLILIALIAIYLIQAIYQSKYWSRVGVPGPPAVPIFGNTFTLMKSKIAYAFRIAEWTKQYGTTFGIQKGRTNILVTSDASIIRDVVVDKFDTFYARETPPTRGDTEIMPRTDVFSAAGKRWKRLRALSSPAFNVQNLKKIMPIIDDSGNEMMNFLEREYAPGKTINIQPFFFEFTLDVICRAALGFEKSMQFKNPYRQDLFYFFRHLAHPVIDLSWGFPKLWKVFHMLEMLIRRCEGVGVANLFMGLEKAVNERKARRLAGDINEEPVDFIDVFLNYEDEVDLSKTGEVYNKSNIHVEKKMSIEEVYSSCFVFLVAGYDTTANVLNFTTFYLAQNPKVQEKLRAEIEEICVDETPTYEQLNQLRYADAVMKETLRLTPIASPALARLCSQDTVVGDKKIPVKKGDCVEVDVVSFHRRKDIWGDDADDFRPERFLEDCKSELNYGFGGGPRICIGMRLAYLEEKMALVKLLRKYRIHSVPENDKLEICNTVVLTTDDMKVRLEEL